MFLFYWFDNSIYNPRPISIKTTFLLVFTELIWTKEQYIIASDETVYSDSNSARMKVFDRVMPLESQIHPKVVTRLSPRNDYPLEA